VAGVKFIDENGGDPGVRLRKRQQKKSYDWAGQLSKLMLPIKLTK
jgi:hypothetical protein